MLAYTAIYIVAGLFLLGIRLGQMGTHRVRRARDHMGPLAWTVVCLAGVTVWPALVVVRVGQRVGKGFPVDMG